MKQAKQIFWNALFLTMASLLMRTIGVAFGVVISNRAGTEAMGLYALLSGVFGFALTVATSGIHLGVTRILTETLERGRSESVRKVMRHAIFYALCCGTLASVLLFLSAPYVGTKWLKDIRTVPSLRLFSVSLPLVSLSAVFGGYFTAVRRPYRSASVQVAEQAVRIFCTLFLLQFAVSGDTEKVCCFMVLGGVLASVISFFPGFGNYLSDRKKHYPNQSKYSAEGVGSELIRTTAPIALTSCIRSALLTLEHILIPNGLRKNGVGHKAALSAYGSIHSMAFPIILYPAALITSFSGLLIPILTECQVKSSNKRINYIISRVFGLTMLFSIGTAGILIFFSDSLGNLLYPGTDTGRYIRLLSPLIPVMYIDTVTDSILKGLGEQVSSMKINIADALLSVILVRILIPIYGIDGYLLTVYCSELFNTVLSINRLLTVTNATLKLVRWIFAPLLCIVLSTETVNLFLNCFNFTVGPNFFTLTVHCILTLSLYLLLLLIFGCIGKEDFRWFRSFFQKEQTDFSEKREDASPAKRTEKTVTKTTSVRFFQSKHSPKLGESTKNQPPENAAFPAGHPASWERNSSFSD